MGDLPILSLPTDYTRSQTPNYRGAFHALQIGPELTERLKALGRGHGATLFMVLLAAYKVLLHRYTQHNDIIVGTASSGRSQSQFAEIVGNFVNPVALRTYPKPNQSFLTYLGQVRNTVRDALAHQDFPFPVLVDRLQLQRTADHWPIYQTWFVLQQAQSEAEHEFAQLALGEDGKSLPWGGWSVESLALKDRVERFDLKLMAAECEQGLLLSFQYRSDLFRAETIEGMSQRFRVLIEGIVAQPEICLRELPLMTGLERKQLIIDWNATKAVYSQDKCLHQLFEGQVEKYLMR